MRIVFPVPWSTIALRTRSHWAIKSAMSNDELCGDDWWLGMKSLMYKNGLERCVWMEKRVPSRCWVALEMCRLYLLVPVTPYWFHAQRSTVYPRPSNFTLPVFSPSSSLRAALTVRPPPQRPPPLPRPSVESGSPSSCPSRDPLLASSLIRRASFRPRPYWEVEEKEVENDDEDKRGWSGGWRGWVHYVFVTRTRIPQRSFVAFGQLSLALFLFSPWLSSGFSPVICHESWRKTRQTEAPLFHYNFQHHCSFVSVYRQATYVIYSFVAKDFCIDMWNRSHVYNFSTEYSTFFPIYSLQYLPPP